MTVSFGNVRPVANAGKSLAVKVENTVTLTGDGTDANGDALSYQWMLSSLPGGSLSEMADSSARITSFTPDRVGAYVAQLVVSDGVLDSEPSAIQIQAFTTQTKTIAALQGLETEIAALDSNAFRNDDMQNLLLNKLNAVIANVDAGKYADAANQLRNDVLPKMDGVGNTEGDNDAWIIDRSSQQVWCQDAQDVVKALEMAASSQPLMWGHGHRVPTGRFRFFVSFVLCVRKQKNILAHTKAQRNEEKNFYIASKFQSKKEAGAFGTGAFPSRSLGTREKQKSYEFCFWDMAQ